VSDFRLNVIAETQKAERSLRQVERVADRATQDRKINIDLRALNKSFNTITSDIKSATNNIKTFYSVSKKVPGVSDKVEQFEKLAKSTVSTAKAGAGLKSSAQAGGILANSLGVALSTGNKLIDTLAKIGFATFALKEAVGVLQSAWNGFFNNTIGREIKLRETILKTQTTLASTNKVFANGKEITDPYQKIVALTGAVGERIDSIRERSIALAGVTSNEVIEVFGIVASQVGQIGGGLKEAEDLAINFAAALGTFGIPLYQARQEIGSILRGDITLDSYLAKALGITNEDIARAKTEVGGVTKFLEDRLAAAVAGQRIAAEGFSGVVSNIADLGELIGQNFGRGLLDPLLAGLSSVFETLFGIRTQLFEIASGAGQAIGRAGQLIISLTAGRTGLGAGDPGQAASAAADVAQRGFKALEEVAQRTVGALSQAIEALKPTALILIDAFKNIAEAFVRIKVGTFEALASALGNIASLVGALAPSLAIVFNLYARFLNTPAVKYFTEVAAVLGLLKRVGLDAITQLALFGRFIFAKIIPAVGGLGTALGGLIAVIATLIASLGKLILLLASFATALIGPATAIPAVAAALKALSSELLTIGKEAVLSGRKLNGAAASFRGLGVSAKAAGASILASLGWIAVIQIGLSVLIDTFGRFQRAQENRRSSDRASEALRRLQTTYKDVGDSADSATKSARDFEQAIVNANYSRNTDKLEEVRKKINQIRYELKPGIQSWGEFWNALSGSEIGRFEERSRRVLGGLLQEEAKIKAELRGVDAQRDREQARKDIQLQAQNRVVLEKEIAQLRRQIDNDLFRQRQAAAQKEVEIFRVAGELRIKQIERANAKLIEGEEGASRTALEALNNYISVRERGELDIEASKKTIAIEVANLERSITDYRLDIEKKIAELRKRSADNERKSAEARQRAAGGTAAASGVSDGFRVGSTGRSTGPHLDIRSPTGNKQAVINEAAAIIKAWQGQGLEYINLSNANIDVTNMVDETQLRAALKEEQEIHARRSGGGAIDIAVPSGTLVPVPVGDPSTSGAGGVQATSLNTGNLFLHGLATSVATPSAAIASSASSEIPEASEAAQNYAAAVRNLTDAMERLRTLQAAVTEANTVEAFEQISKAAFPRIALEQYQDRLIELQRTYDAVSTSAEASFDPERTALEATRLTQIAVINRELKQIQQGISQQNKLSEDERQRALAAIQVRYAQYLQQLERETQLKQAILASERATEYVSQAQTAVKTIREEIEALQLKNRLMAEGVAPEFIQAELAKLEINRETERITKSLNQELTTQLSLQRDLQQQLANAAEPDKAALQQQLSAAQETINALRAKLKGVGAAGTSLAAAQDERAAALTAPGQKLNEFIAEGERRLKDYEGMAIRVSQSVGDAIGNSLTNGITGLVEGTTSIKDIFAQFLQDIGRTLLKEATTMIATYIAIGLAKRFAMMFSSSSGGFNLTNTSFFNGSGGAPSFLDGVNIGNILPRANGGPVVGGSPYIVGERGPELFVPFQQGTVVSNEALQQAATAQIPFTRSAESVNQAQETAQAMQAAGPIEIRYESNVINGVEYVTAEQHRKGMAQAAERGRSLTIQALQNSVKTRGRVGL